MSEPVRSIYFFADENGISPSEPQFAGVQGEHNATEVKFQLSSDLISPEYLYRIEFSDAAGEYDSTDFIPISESFVEYLLPENWTKAGGVGVIHLCVVVLDANGQEEQEVYSLAGRLKFAPRESGGMKTKYEKGLSALIAGAGEATDAANEAAENANAAADRVDEAITDANTATANANRAAASADASAATATSAAGIATSAAATAHTAAGQAQAAKAAADTAAGGANAAAEQAQAAAASAGTAAGTASTAASQANAVAQTVQAKLDAGELKGEKGDKGDTGPRGLQGLSGVYVGGGEMPEGYSVQVDPAGETACYTAGESDSRYLRATEIRRPFTDGVIALTDADDAAFGGVTVLGETHETGTGDKGPDNPYALTGVQPTKVTACGRNLADAARVWVWGNPEFSVEKFPGGFYLQADTWVTRILAIPCSLKAGKTYVVSYQAENVGTGSPKISLYLPALNQYLVGEGKPFVPNADTDTLGIYVGLKDVAEGVKIKISDVRVVLGDTAAPYEPYTGQTVSLPAIAPLWGTGDIRDEYDAATGVETRRWGRVELDGTEAWAVRQSGTGVYGYMLLDVFDAPAAVGVCTHFKFIKNGASSMQTSVCVASASTQKALSVFTAIATLDEFKAYLAAQYAAGTPVTVVYQLDEPIVTRYGPQRIPTYPAYTYLALNAPAEGAVRYPLSAPMQWDGKADKTVSDDRYANVLTGTASGAVACLEDVSPVGPLRRAAALGATTETGEGDKGPDNPYTIAGVQPTKITVCGKNLLPSNATSGTANGLTRTVDENGIIRLSGAATGTAYIAVLSNNGTPHVWLNEKVYRAAEETKSMVLKVVREDGTEAWSNTNTGNNMAIANQVPCGILQASYEFAAGAPDVNTLYPYLGLEANQPYQPYTGQTITLPTLAPLYGDGTVCDEYDAATGVEIRRWGRMTANGESSFYDCSAFTGVMNTVATLRVRLPVRGTQFGPLVCSHFVNKPVWRQDAEGIYQTEAGGVDVNIAYTRLGIAKEASEQEREAAFAAWLRDNPFSVVYRLEAPAVTQHAPARLLPPAPVCRVFADAGSVDVGYNRDMNIVVAKLEAALADLQANQTISSEGDGE